MPTENSKAPTAPGAAPPSAKTESNPPVAPSTAPRLEKPAAATNNDPPPPRPAKQTQPNIAKPESTGKTTKTPDAALEIEFESAPVVAIARSLPEAIRKNVAGVLASEARVIPDLRFPGDAVVSSRPLVDWSRAEERHSEPQATRKEAEEDSTSRSAKAENERKREPEKTAAPVKEKPAEATKTPEAKPPQPQRPIPKAITAGAGGGGDKEATGPSAAERAETVKKMSEQFQLLPGKPETQRNAPLMPPLPGPGQTKEPAKALNEGQGPKENAPAERANQGVAATRSETATNTPTSSKSEPKTEAATRSEGKAETSERSKAPGESNPTRNESTSSREKAETSPQENLRRATQAAREVERGEDFTGMRRSAGYQQAKSEMDLRQNLPQHEAPTSNSEPGELRQSHSSQSSQGESEGRGNQERPGEEMQQHSDRGERHQRRRQNPQALLDSDTEEEEALLELEEKAN